MSLVRTSKVITLPCGALPASSEVNGPPSGQAIRVPKTPSPQPSWPALFQVTTNSPEPGPAATAGLTWDPVVNAFRRKRGPATPEGENLLAMMSKDAGG